MTIIKSPYRCEICDNEKAFELVMFNHYRVSLCHDCDRKLQIYITSQRDFTAYSLTAMKWNELMSEGKKSEADDCYQLLEDIVKELGIILQAYIERTKISKEKKWEKVNVLEDGFG